MKQPTNTSDFVVVPRQQQCRRVGGYKSSFPKCYGAIRESDPWVASARMVRQYPTQQRTRNAAWVLEESLHPREVHPLNVPTNHDFCRCGCVASATKSSIAELLIPTHHLRETYCWDSGMKIACQTYRRWLKWYPARTLRGAQTLKEWPIWPQGLIKVRATRTAYRMLGRTS